MNDRVEKTQIITGIHSLDEISDCFDRKELDVFVYLGDDTCYERLWNMLGAFCSDMECGANMDRMACQYYMLLLTSGTHSLSLFCL